MTAQSPNHIQVVVPKFYEFIPAILNYLADGRERSNKEIYAAVAKRSALSPDQMKELMSNGRRLVYVDRISWGLTYLKQWGGRRIAGPRPSEDFRRGQEAYRSVSSRSPF
jgi:mrr restriction system protein